MFCKNFRITLVAEDEEVIAAGKPNKALEISEVSDCALRIRGRREINRDRAHEKILIEHIEVGQKTVGGGRRQIDGLAIGGDGAGGIGTVERVRKQHGGSPAPAG